MFDIDKLASSILKTISDPIRKLADRLKHLEETVYKCEEIITDFMKYTGLLENFSKQMEEVSNLKLAGFDPSKMYTIEQIRSMVADLIDASSASVEKKIPSEDALVEKLTAILGPAINLLEKRIDDLPKPEPIDYESLKVPELPDIPGMIEEAIGLAIKEHEEKEWAIDQVHSFVLEIVQKEFAKIELPKAPELPDFESLIAELVTNEIKALPKAEPGKSITLEDVKPFLEETIAKLVAAIPPAKDGVGTSGAVIDRNGHLVLTLSNGKTISLGPVVGRDVDMVVVERLVAEKVAAIPKPQDGLGFEDFSVEYDGKRSFTFKFARGDRSIEFPFKVPHMIYLGVYKSERNYEEGDTVTWGGSLWHCNKDTSSKPGEGNPDWTLAAKRGSNAKDIVSLPPKNGPVKG